MDRAGTDNAAADRAAPPPVTGDVSIAGAPTPPLFAGSVLRIGPFSMRIRGRSFIALSVVVTLTVAATLTALMVGTIALSPAELVAVLLGDGRPSAIRSVLGRRLPRAITAVLVGCCLGASGTVVQSLSRNPLGSPDIIGFTTGAATAAVVQIILFGGGIWQTGLAAVGGGLATAVVVYVLARRDRVTSGYRLVMVGIGVGTFLSAATALLILRADIADATTVQLWSSGSLLGRGWPHVVAVLVGALVLFLPLALLVRRVDLLEMGDDTAHGIGIEVERTRFGAMMLAVGLAAIAVAAAGPIAFIAFAAPHMARRVVASPGVQLWLGGAMGGLLLLLADLISQNVDLQLRTPVGLVTSLLGGAYLLWLLARRI